jgi:FMN phosphatase YigB (HAD superfamily)
MNRFTIDREQRPILDDGARVAAFMAAAMTAEIASFDLFDTLVQRAVWRPDDVFTLLAANLPDQVSAWFATERSRAEAAVRRASGTTEITLAAIYAELRRAAPAGFDLTPIMDQEIALEIEGIAADPRIAAAFRALVAAGRRVVIVSDMYLPRRAIETMIERAGLAGHERLYLSSETGHTKASGAVWNVIRADFGLAADARIVHLGDHPAADGAVARRCGITPFLLAPPERRLPTNRYQPTSNALADLPHALLRRALGAQAGDPYWLTLAYLVVAPAAIGMAGLIHSRVRAECRQPFFLARDGLVFQKAYESAWRTEATPSSHYVWSSRRCLNLAAITTLDASDLDFLCSGVSDLTIAEYLQRADLDPADGAVAAAMHRHGVHGQTAVNDAPSRASLRAIFTDLADPITARAGIERGDLLAHLDQIELFDTKALVVDLGWHGSLQRSLIRLGTIARGTVPDITGIYLGTSARRARDIQAEGFLFTDGAPQSVVAATVGRSYEVLELLFSAPESGISHVACRDGVPYPVRLAQTEEAPRLAIAALIHDAVTDVAHAMRPYLRQEHITMLRDLACTRLAGLLTAPDRSDAAHFAAIPHAEGFGAASYRPIVPASARSPFAAARAARTAFWPAGCLARLDPGSRFAVRAINSLHRRITAPA